MIALSGSGSSRGASEYRTETAVPLSRTYKTTGFFPGAMTVQLPIRWNVLEDSRLHFSVAPSGSDYRVLWSIDAWPVRAGAKVTGVPSRASPLIKWLRANPNLRVVEAKASTLGARLAARVVDVRLSGSAVNDDPTCPASKCVNFLRFYGASEPYGLAGNDAIRFYFANIKRQNTSHLLIVAIEARDRADLAVRLPAAERLIHTAKLAVSPG
jgi:hypothetical protein